MPMTARERRAWRQANPHPFRTACAAVMIIGWPIAAIVIAWVLLQIR